MSLTCLVINNAQRTVVNRYLAQVTIACTVTQLCLKHTHTHIELVSTQRLEIKNKCLHLVRACKS